MSEDSNKKIDVNSEEIKSETKNTVNDVKETMKNVNIKNDAKVTTNFVSLFFKDPLSTLKTVANDSKNTNFKNAVILIVLWTLAVLLKSLFGSHWTFRYFGTNILSIIKNILAPALGIIVLSAIVYFVQKSKDSKGKKSLTTIISTITAANSPLILAVVLSLLTLFSASIAKITNPIITFSTVISIVFNYFAIKALIGQEENSKFVKTFMLVEGIYCISYFVITFLEIYLPVL